VYVGLNCLENLCLCLLSGVPHFFFLGLHPCARRCYVNSTTQLNRELRTHVSDTSKSASSLHTIINKQYHFMIFSGQFPVPVRSALKSNSTNWCGQNLSKLALNALTVQASTTELGKLFQTFSLQCRKEMLFVSHSEMTDFAIYSCCLWCYTNNTHNFKVARLVRQSLSWQAPL